MANDRLDQARTSSSNYTGPVVDLPLKYLKEKMGVLTLNEMIAKLEADYGHISVDSLEEFVKQVFSSAVTPIIG